MSHKIKSLSDKELYQQCKEYGGNARRWMRKFAGLLPEVYRRQLYKRHDCASIYEFAGKLAGMSQQAVDRVLRLGEKLKDKPKLLEQFESGSQGWTKLEKVATVAKPGTDTMWAEKLETLGTHSLEAYIKERNRSENFHVEEITDKRTRENSGQRQNESFAPYSREEVTRFSFPVGVSLKSKLELFKQKLEKEKGQALGWAEVMEEMLRACEENTELKKVAAGKKVMKQEVTVQVCPECVSAKENGREKNREVTRYIPADAQKIIQQRSGGICEFQGCGKVGEIYHHVRRFAIKKNHDPNFIRLLCKAHEGILQSGLVENEEMEPEFWKVREEPEWWDLKNKVDSQVAEFRKGPRIIANSMVL